MTAYTERFITRGYEAGPSRRVPLPMVFQYLEHLRWRCIVDPESGLGDLVDQGYFFVVHKQRLALDRAFGQDTEVEASVWTQRVGRSAIDLHHEVRRVSDGVRLAHAEVTGLWLAPNRKLSRIPDELRAFAARLAPPSDADACEPECHGARLETSYIRPPDVPFPTRDLVLDAPDASEVPERAAIYETRVRPSDLDIFAHVNAATYLRFCDDARAALPEVFDTRARGTAFRAAVHYQRETLEGEVLRVATWRDDNGLACFVLSAGDTVRATARFEVADDAS